DTEDKPPRLLLFIDGDLGETAVNTAPLVAPVLEKRAGPTLSPLSPPRRAAPLREKAAALTTALLPPQPGAGGRGIVVGAARRAIASATGWTPTQPLSGMRCLTRAAFEAATPPARG